MQGRQFSCTEGVVIHVEREEKYGMTGCICHPFLMISPKLRLCVKVCALNRGELRVVSSDLYFYPILVIWK